MMQYEMTWGKAKSAGWRFRPGDLTLQKGYVSRKREVTDSTPVYKAGGSRKGELFILMPNWKSTTFCFRQYLEKAKDLQEEM